jgi:hypothetical protein
MRDQRTGILLPVQIAGILPGYRRVPPTSPHKSVARRHRSGLGNRLQKVRFVVVH